MPEYHLCINYFVNSFDIMTQCWSVLPNTRPNFTKLHKTFDDILEQEADYLNLED